MAANDKIQQSYKSLPFLELRRYRADPGWEGGGRTPAKLFLGPPNFIKRGKNAMNSGS